MGFSGFRKAMLGGVALGALAMAAPANASFVTVSFGFGVNTYGTPSISYTPNGAVGLATTVTNMNNISSYGGLLVGGSDNTGVNGAPTSITWPSSFSYSFSTVQNFPSFTEIFPSPSGSYTATFNKLFMGAATPSDTLGLTWSGTMTGGLLGGATQAIFLTATLDNNQNLNTDPTTAAFTESSSPPPIVGSPEPASMAVLGVGLAALGAARRRRNRKG